MKLNQGTPPTTGLENRKMGLEKLAAKVMDYNERLENGKASKIKPHHVEKVLHKLRSKPAELEAEIAWATSADKKARLDSKLQIARTYRTRGVAAKRAGMTAVQISTRVHLWKPDGRNVPDSFQVFDTDVLSFFHIITDIDT